MRDSRRPTSFRTAATAPGAAAVGIALALALAGCGRGGGAGGAGGVNGGDETVVVMAASSLTDVLEEVSSTFELEAPSAAVVTSRTDVLEEVPAVLEGLGDPSPADRSGAVKVVAVLAGSSALVAQLAEGAEADVLMTADAATMQRAVDNGSVRGRVTAVAANSLVLAVAPGNPGRVGSLEDLGRADLLVGLCAAGVPCGTLADRALSELGVEPAVDTRELNARALAAKIALGELDAGLVYATDATASGLETVAAASLRRFANPYLMASIDADPPAPVRAVLEAFEPGGPGAEALLEAGFGPP